jgi:hypothetical protein
MSDTVPPTVRTEAAASASDLTKVYGQGESRVS